MDSRLKNGKDIEIILALLKEANSYLKTGRVDDSIATLNFTIKRIENDRKSIRSENERRD